MKFKFQTLRKVYNIVVIVTKREQLRSDLCDGSTSSNSIVVIVVVGVLVVVVTVVAALEV